MVLLTRFNSLEEAFLARAMLDSAGIDAFIPDEYTLQNNWIWTTALEGVRLMVPEETLDDARNILKLSQENLSPYLTDITCPQCGSTKVMNASLKRKAFAALIAILHLPLPFSRMKYACTDCGHRWK